jgi:NitT/TauT family transport system permease protein
MMAWLGFAVLAWVLGWSLNVWLSRQPPSRITALASPIIFGLTLIAVWEGVVNGFEINQVLLPAPSVIAVRFVASTHILWVDFVQTVLKGAMSGYVIGCGSAFLIAVVSVFAARAFAGGEFCRRLAGYWHGADSGNVVRL